MKTWDVVVIGGGVIGLSVALELNKRGRKVLVVDRSEPGREASYAAAGMLANGDPHTPELLLPLATASARLYPEFIHELQDESGISIDYRSQGTIGFFSAEDTPQLGRPFSVEELTALEPHLAPPGSAHFLPEASVDPRCLVDALVKSLHRRQVDIASGAPAIAVEINAGKVLAVRTEKSRYATNLAINCAGAWATRIVPIPLRTRPVKGQMLSIVRMKHGERFSLRHVVRTTGCYLVPRTDGRIVIGSTIEEAGYDKRVDTDVIQSLHQRAANLLPELGEGRILEAWTGLRPGTPDNLPLLGETSVGGYLVATGHYRDGILLAPITARIISKLACGETLETNLIPFSPERFG